MYMEIYESIDNKNKEKQKIWAWLADIYLSHPLSHALHHTLEQEGIAVIYL